ncbi:hypothetical protein CH295_18835 [Rhodococcus sp. 14-2483-1-2]|nr:hypothetical protein CH295_18835 [Rhodococcus sp. 14-2483-1-2]
MAVVGSVVAAGLTSGVAQAEPEWSPAPTPRVDMKPCNDVILDFDSKIDARGGGSAARELECATIEVPMDYAVPDGRKIEFTFSRLRAADPEKRRGVLMTHQGGPGQGSITYPLELANRPIREAVREYDIVSFDYRGTGASTPLNCPPTSVPYPTVTGTQKVDFDAGFDWTSQANKALVECEPEYVRQITTPNIARDVDRVREALGEEQMAYYGVSYGTVVGMTYRAMFDDKVSRMWLDSILDPEFRDGSDYVSQDALSRASNRRLFAYLAQNQRFYNLGDTEESTRASVEKIVDDAESRYKSGDTVLMRNDILSLLLDQPAMAARSLLTLRDGQLPSKLIPVEGESNPLFSDDKIDSKLSGSNESYTPVFCALAEGGRDADDVWNRYMEWRAETPADNLVIERVPSSICAGWPFSTDRPDWSAAGKSSPLQIGAHRYESTTPYAGAEKARIILNGSLFTTNDARHSASIFTECGAKRISEFLQGSAPYDSECLAREES